VLHLPRPAGRLRGMRGGAKALLVLACLLVAPLATAGTIWRCDGPDGVISYVSKRVAGAKCTAVSHYKPEPARPARTAPAPAAGAVVSGGGAPPAGSQMTNAAPPSGASPGSGTRRVQGQVYSYIKDGVRHYTSAPPPKGAVGRVRTINYSFLEPCLACSPAAAHHRLGRTCPTPRRPPVPVRVPAPAACRGRCIPTSRTACATTPVRRPPRARWGGCAPSITAS